MFINYIGVFFCCGYLNGQIVNANYEDMLYRIILMGGSEIVGHLIFGVICSFLQVKNSIIVMHILCLISLLPVFYRIIYYNDAQIWILLISKSILCSLSNCCIYMILFYFNPLIRCKLFGLCTTFGALGSFLSIFLT
jgi:hypothetical protein